MSERSGYARPLGIGTGVVILAVVLLSAPPLILFLPVAVAAMTVLYLVFARNQKRAHALAEKHLGPGGRTELDVELSPGMSDALVLNDWGVVYVKSRKKPRELAWHEIARVDEPAIAMLEFHSDKYPPFRADLSQDRYFLAIEAIHSKIPNRTDFTIDPVTGQSTFLRKLQKTPFEWRGRWGRFIVSSAGLEHEKGRMGWHEVRSVDEVRFEGDEVNPFWELKFTSDALSFDVRSTWLDDGRQIGYSGYYFMKSILAERLPDTVRFDRRPLVPRDRAIDEFNRCQEAYKVGFALALKSGKLAYFEKRFAHMLALVDKFSLEYAVDARTFFQDYAELLRRTDRSREAERMQDRAALTASR